MPSGELTDEHPVAQAHPGAALKPPKVSARELVGLERAPELTMSPGGRWTSCRPGTCARAAGAPDPVAGTGSECLSGTCSLAEATRRHPGPQ